MDFCTNILQANIRTVTLDLQEYAKSNNHHIILLQEPYYVTNSSKVPQTGFQQFGSAAAIILVKIRLPYTHW